MQIILINIYSMFKKLSIFPFQHKKKTEPGCLQQLMNQFNINSFLVTIHFDLF